MRTDALNNTSPIVVATLAQGVQQDRSGQISVAGTLPFMTSFSVDGISTQRTRGGGASRELFPSVESIEEFKVSAANDNAEFMQVTDTPASLAITSSSFGRISATQPVDQAGPRTVQSSLRYSSSTSQARPSTTATPCTDAWRKPSPSPA
jgi:hypothetical protein